MRPKVKMCGTASVEDAILQAEAGADYMGVVVEVSYSPRSQAVESARVIFSSVSIPGLALVFDVSVSRAVEIARITRSYGLQLLGHESPDYVAELHQRTGAAVWKSIHLPPASDGNVDVDSIAKVMQSYVNAGAEALLLDTAVVEGNRTRFGGTGKTNNWEIARELISRVDAPVWLAGGLSPENAREAIRFVKPYGLDLCSGLEASPGKKDPDKVKRFMDAVR